MSDKIKYNLPKEKIVSAKTVAEYLKSGATLAMSGYSTAGYPKDIVHALVERKSTETDLSFSVITGANAPWLDETMASAELISRKAPMIASKTLASQVNAGKVKYVEQQMCQMPKLLKKGSFGKIDTAIVEASAITEDGLLIPSTSIGYNHIFMDMADEIIIEINESAPEILHGLHDIYLDGNTGTPLKNVNDRVGKIGIPLNFDKVKYIVVTNTAECNSAPISPAVGASKTIAENLIEFLKVEFSDGKIPPFQTGFGNIANAISEVLQSSEFKNLSFFCGGISTPILELLSSGKADYVSTGGIEMKPETVEILEGIDNLKEKLVIRNGDIINNSESIAKVGLIALNSAVEVDIYGNVNSSHISGTRVVNGLGGGANFAQNSSLSIVLIQSEGKKGDISTVVPMVSHCDITEHDVDILITENGVADLRGLCDTERAEAIISNCASETYKPLLSEYLKNAVEKCGGHHPQLPLEAFDWYTRLKQNGSMKK